MTSHAVSGYSMLTNHTSQPSCSNALVTFCLSFPTSYTLTRSCHTATFSSLTFSALPFSTLSLLHQEIFKEAMTAETSVARTEAEIAEEELELCSASASFLLLASLLRLSSAFRLRSSLYWCRHLEKKEDESD